MKKALLVFYCFLIILKVSAQSDNNNKVFILEKSDSNYLVVNSSNKFWYTFELETDTFFKMKNRVFYYSDKILQINTISLNDIKPYGVSSSEEDEKEALRWHKKWELDFQKKSFGKKLKSEEEFYTNINGKNFLIWWFDSPNNIPSNATITIEKNNTKKFVNRDSLPIAIKATKQLYLDFIVSGNTIASINIPLLEIENRETEIKKLKQIANSVNTYGWYIDLKVLENRSRNNNKFVFEDSLNLLYFEAPKWLNILWFPKKNILMTSFPEKDNIINATAICWEYKTKNQKLSDYILERKAINKKRENIKILVDSTHMQKVFYTEDNFYGCDVYMESEHLFCHVNFTATETTYDFNLKKFDELVSRIKMK